MATWSNLVLISVLAVSTLSLPQPDEGAYNIPRVGTGRRSQYFVLHDDGTYKYGHDTGEGAFESARLKTGGDLDGEFGYKDPEGQDVRVQYKSGVTGFQAQGSHLPVPHPDFAAAHAAARSRAPFQDPLADSNTDASYNFQFAGEEQSRNEVSDADGNVRGSYSYVDEEGRTRTFTYTAGRGIGFVVEGDDLPQAIESEATPAATRLSGSTRRFSSPSSSSTSSRPVGATSSQRLSGSSTFRGSATQSVSGRPASSSTSHFGSRVTSTGSSVGQTYQAPSRTSSTFGSASRGSLSSSASRTPSTFSSASRTPSTFSSSGTRASSTFGSSASRTPSTFGSSANRASSTFSSKASRAPSTFGSSANRASSTFGSSASRTPSTFGSSATRSSSTFGSSASRAPSTFSSSSTTSTAQTRLGSRPFEEANTRSEVRPDGGYSFAYETSSHSRAESGDSDNNVDGKFDFVAEDDGQRRAIVYEAGSDSGFIAEGAHIPVGPEVPGAPSGQPTGRIVPVQEIPFVDPLANTGLDASYNFAFDSDEYSRTETADEDGNVQGTYSVVDEDGTRRTYRFRAGKGIGFETEEISVSRGPVPARVRGSSSSTSSVTSGSSSFGASGSSSFGASGSSFGSRGSSSGSSFTTGGSSAFGTSGSRGSASTSGGVISYQGASSTGARRPSTTSFSSTSSSSSSSSTSPSRTVPLRSIFKPTSTQEVFPGFTLHQYDVAKNPEKFGYVLTFDD